MEPSTGPRAIVDVKINEFSDMEEKIQGGKIGRLFITGLTVNPKDRGWGMLIAGYDGWSLTISKDVKPGLVNISVRKAE